MIVCDSVLRCEGWESFERDAFYCANDRSLMQAIRKAWKYCPWCGKERFWAELKEDKLTCDFCGENEFPPFAENDVHYCGGILKEIRGKCPRGEAGGI